MIKTIRMFRISTVGTFTSQRISTKRLSIFLYSIDRIITKVTARKRAVVGIKKERKGESLVFVTVLHHKWDRNGLTSEVGL